MEDYDSLLDSYMRKRPLNSVCSDFLHTEFYYRLFFAISVIIETRLVFVKIDHIVGNSDSVRKFFNFFSDILK